MPVSRATFLPWLLLFAAAISFDIIVFVFFLHDFDVLVVIVVMVMAMIILLLKKISWLDIIVIIAFCCWYEYDDSAA